MSTPLLQQFPSLASYPPDFLKDLLSDPQLTEAFLFTLPEVQDLAAEVERLARENDNLARHNLSLRDELFALRDATSESYNRAEDLKRQWADIEKAQTGLYQRQRPSFIYMRLRHSLTDQDDASERIATSFIEGSSGDAGNGQGNGNGTGNVNGSTPGSRVDSPAFADDRGRDRAVDDFITAFKAERKTYHKRAIWAERWARGEVAWRD